jgi:hypothetical protein
LDKHNDILDAIKEELGRQLGAATDGRCPRAIRATRTQPRSPQLGRQLDALRKIVRIELHLEAEAVERRPPVTEARSMRHDELEAIGDQHLQDRRQRAFRQREQARDLVAVAVERADEERPQRFARLRIQVLRRQELTIYRLAFGKPRQDDLLERFTDLLNRKGFRIWCEYDSRCWLGWRPASDGPTTF